MRRVLFEEARQHRRRHALEPTQVDDDALLGAADRAADAGDERAGGTRVECALEADDEGRECLVAHRTHPEPGSAHLSAARVDGPDQRRDEHHPLADTDRPRQRTCQAHCHRRLHPRGGQHRAACPVVREERHPAGGVERTRTPPDGAMRVQLRIPNLDDDAERPFA